MKDNDNVLNYNIWSAGEYENNPEIFYGNPITSRICANEWSIIGEQGIKLTKKNSSESYVRIYHNQSFIDKTVTASATIKTYNSAAYLYLVEANSSSIIQSRSVFVPANSVSNVNVSLVSGSNNTRFGVQFNIVEDTGSINIDNIKLIQS